MKIYGFSINHRTCDIKLRESLALDDENKKLLIEYLKTHGVKEGIVLSTCNRTEIFVFGDDKDFTLEDLIKAMLRVKNIMGLNDDNYEVFYDDEVVRHLFEVASGIDSLIVGDSQILGQVKEAFQFSSENNFSRAVFNKLQLATLKLGKRVISETVIGEGAITVSYAAIKLIEKYFNTLHNKKILIIGAGETAELAAVHIAEKQPKRLFVTNRTEERGKALARKLNGEFIDFNDFKNNLYEYDVILSATSAPEFILTYDEIKSAMKKRRGKILVIMDIALPRDIDPKVADLDEVFYQDIDSLNIIIDKNIERRKAEIPKVKEIIENELELFYDWFNTLDVLPTIKLLRAFFEEIRRDEYEKIKHKLHKHELEKVENMTKRLIGRILHNPTINLKRISKELESEEEKAAYYEMIRELFNLDENASDENKSEIL